MKTKYDCNKKDQIWPESLFLRTKKDCNYRLYISMSFVQNSSTWLLDKSRHCNPILYFRWLKKIMNFWFFHSNHFYLIIWRKLCNWFFIPLRVVASLSETSVKEAKFIRTLARTPVSFQWSIFIENSMKMLVYIYLNIKGLQIASG